MAADDRGVLGFDEAMKTRSEYRENSYPDGALVYNCCDYAVRSSSRESVLIGIKVGSKSFVAVQIVRVCKIGLDELRVYALQERIIVTRNLG
jgi:hypothetical protein